MLPINLIGLTILIIFLVNLCYKRFIMYTNYITTFCFIKVLEPLGVELFYKYSNHGTPRGLEKTYASKC